MAKHLFVVFTNAVPGKEDEFNAWYSDTHIKDLVKIPGVSAARRYTLSHTQRMPPPHPWKYMSIYELETDNIQGFLDELSKRRGTPDLVGTDAIDRSSVASFFYEPMISCLA